MSRFVQFEDGPPKSDGQAKVGCMGPELSLRRDFLSEHEHVISRSWPVARFHLHFPASLGDFLSSEIWSKHSRAYLTTNISKIFLRRCLIVLQKSKLLECSTQILWGGGWPTIEFEFMFNVSFEPRHIARYFDEKTWHGKEPFLRSSGPDVSLRKSVDCLGLAPDLHLQT